MSDKLILSGYKYFSINDLDIKRSNIPTTGNFLVGISGMNCLHLPIKPEGRFIVVRMGESGVTIVVSLYKLVLAWMF